MRHVGRNLASWDISTFRLVVGNVPQGDRGWKGTVQSIELADTALTPGQIPQAYAARDLRTVLGKSLLASYRIDGSAPSADLTRQSPELIWDGPDVTAKERQPSISGGDWLISTAPISRLCREIRGASAFTIRCKFESDLDSQSPELGRIVAIASDSLHCNVTIGQQLSDLVIRLRTPLTGDNGTNPAWKIDDFFVRPGPHDLILTYDDPVLRIYVDGPLQSVTANVPADFGDVAHYLARAMTLPFAGFLPELYRWAFFLISFTPLALVLAMITANRRLDARGRHIALGIGLLAPALAMEFVLVVICKRSFRTDNLLMGIAATALVAFSAAHWLRRLDNAKLVG